MDLDQLAWKPADLDLHCFQSSMNLGSYCFKKSFI